MNYCTGVHPSFRTSTTTIALHVEKGNKNQIHVLFEGTFQTCFRCQFSSYNDEKQSKSITINESYLVGMIVQ